MSERDGFDEASVSMNLQFMADHLDSVAFGRGSPNGLQANIPIDEVTRDIKKVLLSDADRVYQLVNELPISEELKGETRGALQSLEIELSEPGGPLNKSSELN